MFIKVFSTALAVMVLMANLALAAPGDLDTTFNAPKGYSFYDGPMTGTNLGQAVALQPDGKLVVVGYSWNGLDNDILVLRYNPNGSLDNTFGSNGAVTYGGGDYEKGSAVALQSDGKIVVVGQSYIYSNLLVLRYNPDGTPDSTFGTEGVVIYANGGGFDVVKNGVAIQSDGKIIVVGGYWNDLTYIDALVLRYNSDGTLDDTFGSNGVVTYNNESYPYAYAYANAVALQPDGKIVVTGPYSGNMGNNYYDGVLVLRYDINGTLDNTFGSNGVVIYDREILIDSGNALAIQPDGKIVVVGDSGVDLFMGVDVDILVLRFNSDGTLDDTFGNYGMVIYNGPANLSDYGNAVALQTDGKIVVVGTSDRGPDWLDVLVLRYNTDGTLDNAFGSHGTVTFNSPADWYDYGNAVALQPDGKIIVVGEGWGESSYDVLVMRLIGYSGSISGKFTLAYRGTMPLRRLTVNLTGTANATASTDSSGNYTFPSLPPGDYTITPCKKDYTFTPASRNITLTEVTPTVTGQDFSARLAPYIISGKVTNLDQRPFRGVTITLTNGGCTQTTITDFYGAYRFRVPNGTYTLSASKDGYTFDPPITEVTINGNHKRWINFIETSGP